MLNHLDINHCWLQGYLSSREMKVELVASADNPADLMTKWFSREDVQKHLRAMSVMWVVRTLASC